MFFKKLRIILFLIFVTIVILSINANSAFLLKEKGDYINAFTEDNLLRLHVIANSNSPKDQYIKSLVRERLIEHIRSNDNLNLDLQALEEYINGILEKEGVKYRGRLELGEFDFPARTYAELRLAAGNYLALKIILGKGEGSNWWCVLLPPLCIEEAENNASDKKLELRLKMVEWIRDLNKKEVIESPENKKLVTLGDNFKEIKLEPAWPEFKLIDIEVLNVEV